VAVVVFLRGMNLGKRRITNGELVQIFTGAGHHEVTAYQASGNVILGADETADASRISDVLATSLGYPVPVFVRTVSELDIIASASPVKGMVGTEGGKPQVVFLGQTNDVDLRTVFPEGHMVQLIGTELHWLPPTGLNELGHLQKKMDDAFGPTTTRTLGTVERLANRLT
jgi:uncharacterized protein (DUF1697 family)